MCRGTPKKRQYKKHNAPVARGAKKCPAGTRRIGKSNMCNPKLG